MKHEPFLALPPETKQKLDVALTQGKTTKVCAEMLKADGFFADTSVPTLARALREYRTDTITIPAEARRQAFEQHGDPRTRARVREMIDAYEVHARWRKIIDAAEKTHWMLTEQMSKAGAAAALSDRLRQSSLTLSKLYADYTKFMLDSGLIPKAPTVHHILAANIVIKDNRDAVAVMEAVLDFYARTGDTHPWVEQIQAMQSRASLPAPEPLSPEALEVLADMRRMMAEATAEKRAALAAPSPAEPVDEPRVPIDLDEFEAPEVELLPRQLRHERGRVIEHDDMPDLETIW